MAITVAIIRTVHVIKKRILFPRFSLLDDVYLFYDDMNTTHDECVLLSNKLKILKWTGASDYSKYFNFCNRDDQIT